MRNQKGGIVFWVCILLIVCSILGFIIFNIFIFSKSIKAVERKGLKYCIEEIWYGTDNMKNSEVKDISEDRSFDY